MKFGEPSSMVDKPGELMSIVVLAEKPSVAEDIAKVLGISKKEATHWQGDGIVVTWAVGHMLELKYMVLRHHVTHRPATRAQYRQPVDNTAAPILERG